jgi:hypothetical protein
MRRDLSIIGLSRLVYATALVFGSFAICHAGEADDILGEWTTQGHAARVRIERCTLASEQVCGVVTWLWEPVDAKGAGSRCEESGSSTAPSPRDRICRYSENFASARAAS